MDPLLRPWHAHATTLLLVHLVWSTRRRSPWLAPHVDAVLATLLAHKARALDCQLLAAGNADDHVHVLVCQPPRIAVAKLAHRLKGASSYALHRARLVAPECAWQVGYWAESVSPHERYTLADYVRRQRQHHGEPAPAEAWEPMVDLPPSPPGGRA